MTLDEAIQKFAAYARHEGDFDELDFKEYIINRERPSPTDLRTMLTDHLYRAIPAAADRMLSEYLLEEVIDAYQKIAIYAYRGNILAENLISYDEDGTNRVWDYDGIGQMVVGNEQ